MHTIKITPNLLFEYQCTSVKFIRLPNRIEKNRFGSENRIESSFFCPNWNALLSASSYQVQEGTIQLDAKASDFCPRCVFEVEDRPLEVP